MYRWTIRATSWTPGDWTRKQGRQKTRWRDVKRQIGPFWARLAQHKHLWDRSREGFLRQEGIQTVMMMMMMMIVARVTQPMTVLLTL